MPDIDWPTQLYELLRSAGVTQFAYVPDAGHRVVIDRSLADPDVHSIPLTSRASCVTPSVGMLATTSPRLGNLAGKSASVGIGLRTLGT